MKDIYEHEEEFHKRDKKAFRKERRIAQKVDRSKYKISDQKKKKKVTRHSASQDSLLRGRILSITGEGILVNSGKKNYLCSLRGFLKKERSRHKNLIAVGDFVEFSKKGDQGQILNVEDRISELLRTDISGRKKQLLAANIDIVFITTSVVLPLLKPFLIDRYIIAARKGNMQPVILINKIDLFKGKGSRSSEVREQKALYQDFLRAYKKMDVPLLSISCETGEGLDEIEKIMKNKASVFSGQSGVGKSSLINELLGLDLPTKEVIEKTAKGQHTTTTAKLIPLKKGGFCIDTPGIRSFGLWDLKKEDVIHHFTEIAKFAKGCKFPNCLHIDEPKCMVKKAAEEEKLHPLLFASYRNLILEAVENG